MIDRPTPLNYVPYAQARGTLRELVYVGLSADCSRPISRMIMKATNSAYCHAFLIGHGGADVLLLSESTAPCAQVVALSARIAAESGLIDIFRVADGMNDAARSIAWDWSLRCAGNPYSYLDDGLIWLDRYLGTSLPPIPNSDDPRGCRRDCSCQVHAALRLGGLQPLISPYDCMVAPCDLCEVANPALFQYVCTPTWP
jgi:hypothetical protein